MLLNGTTSHFLIDLAMQRKKKKDIQSSINTPLDLLSQKQSKTELDFCALLRFLSFN